MTKTLNEAIALEYPELTKQEVQETSERLVDFFTLAVKILANLPEEGEPETNTTIH